MEGRSLSGFLLDTHIWLWHAFEDVRLPSGLRRAIDRGSNCCLSPASVWEVGLLVERGRLQLNTPVRQWVAQALDRLPLREAPLTNEVAVRVHEIHLRDRDPADHFLAATALVYDLTLLTVDPNLTEADWLPTRSR